MPNRTSVIPVVTICDARGTMIWTNHPSSDYAPGVPVWDYAELENRELVKDQVARTSFLNEPQEFEASNDQGERYHFWIWPMNTADLGVCIIGLQMPGEMKLLTARERECLEMLSEGRSTSEIAKEFDVSVSTVHTYLKRAREKLHLGSLEQLIAFASRYLPRVPRGR
jgi:DNA-binding CsgD family transcriptional regulator